MSKLNTVVSQLSDNDTMLFSSTLAVHAFWSVSICTTEDGQFNTGTSLSSIVMVCWQVLELPDTSVTVQVTTVSPRGKIAGASLIKISSLAAVQLSAIVGLMNPILATAVPQVPESVSAIMSEAQVILGDSVSLTVTVKEHCAVFPPPSTIV